MPGNIPSDACTVKYGSIPHVGKEVSRLVLGSAFFSPPNKSFAFSMLDEFVRLGGNTLETAHSYGDGDCEYMIGQWMAERKMRERIVVITKGCHHFDLRSRVTPECITSDLTESLSRLQTDYIDIYLLHRDDPSRSVDELVECLNEHHKAGRIRAYGGSNWTPTRIQAANDFARKHNMTPFAVGSPHYSLAVPHREPWPGCIWLSAEDRKWYEKNDFPLIAWSAQARGLFGRHFVADELEEGDSLIAWVNADNLERLKRAKRLAERHGVSANAVALSFVLAQKMNAFAAVGPGSIEELHDSFSALSIQLTADELRWLNLEAP